MKSLFVTIFIIGVLFLGYDYFMAPPSERVVFPRPPHTEAPAVTSEETKPEEKKEVAAAPKPKATTGTDTAKPAPKAPETPKTAESSASHPPVSGGFQPPKFDSLETMTSEWQKIPPIAFVNRRVTLAKPVQIKMSVGSSTLPAGSSVAAMGLENGQLVVAPTAESAARGVVALDDTDFKKQIHESYDRWKEYKIDMMKRQYERRLAQAESTPAAVDTTAVGDAGKPVRSGDGSYPLLMAKMKSGDIIEITPTNIARWGEATQETIKGVPTWSIDVSYTAKTMFGIQTVDTTAHIQNGRVVDWVYKSGEPVP